jgi:cytochrome c1
VWPDLPTMPPAWFAKVKQCRHGVPADVKVVLAHRVNLIGRSMTEVAA